MGYRCERCGHQWLPRGDSAEEPRVCPRCKSPYWNRPRRTRPELEQTFRELADTWRRETAASSVIQKKIMHPAYQRIIGMGPDAVPLLLRELEARPGYWFWALSSITGEDPVRIDASFAQAVEDWLAWGRDRGFTQ